MKYYKNYGIFRFKGSEDDDAFIYIWTCLLDTSFWGRIELTWRIWTKRPPKRYWEIMKED